MKLEGLTFFNSSFKQGINFCWVWDFFQSCSFPGSAWERVLGGSAACSVRRWQSHLGKRSQAEPGNEHRNEFALNKAHSITPGIARNKHLNFK